MDTMKVNQKQKEYYLEQGYWGHETLLDRFLRTVERFPDREYVVDDRGNRHTYSQVDVLSSRIASYLKDMGIKPGDCVSFQVPVWSEFAVIAMGCLKAGAVMHPIAMCYEEPDLIHAMNKADTKIYFGTAWFRGKDYEARLLAVMDRVAGLKHAVFLDSLGPVKGGFTTYREILETYDPLPREEYGLMDGLEVALILGTSGTTGNNKGVMLTHSNIIFSEEQFNLELGLDENDIMFMPAPLNHATGFHHGIIAPMLLGAKVVLQQKFKCPEAIHIMNREKCTYSMGSTPFIYDILKYLEKEGGSLESLKFYLCGGAPVPEDMVLRASAFGICLCEVYGSTESVPHVFVRPWETLTQKERTSGRPLEGIQVRVVDEQGREVPPGIVGEEISRGPNVFVGYLKDREETDRVLTDDGWFYSGDLCVMDEAGNIRIVGRKKDMIVRGGEKLNSNYIDEALEGCPGVADHAVIGMPDERLGERICAYVVPEQGVCVGLDQVLSYMKEKHVPKRYWPERLEQIKEIPRTGSGKVKKYLLLEDLKKRG